MKNKVCDKREESIISQLSALYRQYGYRRYKPSCFEEYTLYQENKDFLIGKNVITFSDLNGKLMAMRPDVTLSLVRHSDISDRLTEKFFYNEKVYRQFAGGRNYKEISQTGAEVVGAIDGAVVGELTILICKTLEAISDNYIIDISHMGFTEGLLNEFPAHRNRLCEFLRTKNLHDFYALASREMYPEKLKNAFEMTVNACGSPQRALKSAKSAILNSTMRDAMDELYALFELLNEFGYAEKININFSATANADYYNGVIFNGYVKNIPHCVLTGGRYDKLIDKFGKCGGAIGFALYLGETERYFAKDSDSVDYVVIYDKKTQIQALKIAQKLFTDGASVRISAGIPDGLAFKELIDLTVEERPDD